MFSWFLLHSSTSTLIYASSNFHGPYSFHGIHDVNFVPPLQGCSTTLNESFGQIEFTTTSDHDVRCYWKIHNAGISEAVAFIAVQELNLYYCRYKKGILCYLLCKRDEVRRRKF